MGTLLVLRQAMPLHSHFCKTQKVPTVRKEISPARIEGSGLDGAHVPLCFYHPVTFLLRAGTTAGPHPSLFLIMLHLSHSAISELGQVILMESGTSYNFMDPNFVRSNHISQ